MSYRPADWSPLTTADPVPGDPDEVGTMAQHYADTAVEISTQVRLLERIALVPCWEGEAARTFTEAAGDLAEKLGKARRRYAELATALRGWVAPLETAQTDSLAALREAQAAQGDLAASAGPGLTGVAEPTPEQVSAETRRQGAQDVAQDRLAGARRRLEAALSALDDAADRVADDIRDAANYGADSRWDRFKGWVQDHAKIIKIIAEVAAVLATVVAVIALAITSPVWAPIAAGVAVALGVVALVAHTMLASAGEGSWTDVALDVFALVTFGIGRVAIRGVRGAVAGTKLAAAATARSRAAQAVLGQYRAPLGVARWATRTRIPLGPLRGTATRYTGRIVALGDRAGAEAARAVLEAPKPAVSVWQAARRGDRELAEHLTELNRLRALAPAEAAAAAARTQRLARLFVGGAAVDVADKVSSAVSALGGPDIKPDLRYTIPTIDLPPLPLPLPLPLLPQPFRLASGRP